MIKAINVVCASALLGATLLTPVFSVAETWQQGGLSSNQVSGHTANVQKNFARTMQWIGLISSTISLFTPWWAINVDFFGNALDYKLWQDAKHRKASWSEPIPQLEAAIRQMGSRADLEGECEGEEEGETCNEVNATLDHTEVHIQTLKNVGLEALEDVAGSVLISPAELIAAAPTIQTGFGTEIEGALDPSASAGTLTSSGTVYFSDHLTDYGSDGTNLGTRTTTRTTNTRTEAETQNIRDRKLAHLQLTGTAGVARADLGATVARSERAAFGRLSSYIGSGDGLIANIKVLCGLDLTLTQRLNTLNMLQGQQVANEAASALQFVTDEE